MASAAVIWAGVITSGASSRAASGARLGLRLGRIAARGAVLRLGGLLLRLRNYLDAATHLDAAYLGRSLRR